jgi:endonuclease/exonuclease/phosphatase family metal-dependent hydrolase
VTLARSLGLALYYAPSMRNGPPSMSDEDRGNAILSTLPLSELSAIELPFERQRRVAVAATVSGRGADGSPWSLRVASVHLDNLASPRRLWLFAAGARARQSRRLVEVMNGESVVLGGDFNTWGGFDEPAYRQALAAFPDTSVRDTRPTFGWGLRLDHLFFRLPEGWTADSVRLDDRFGSDHYPIMGKIERNLVIW